MEDKEFFFEKATTSDATDYWYSSKIGEKVPDRKAFFDDFEEYYFTDFKNTKGRCFHIIEEGSKIGQINYNQITEGTVEIDIIIYNKSNWSKGYGSSSVKLMSAYLEEKYHVKSIYIEVHSENLRAVKAYEKAGFEKSEVKEDKGQTYFRLQRENKFLN